MKHAWRTLRIGDLGRVITGSTPDGEDAGRFEGTFPFITPTDLDLDRRTPEISRFLSTESAVRLSKRIIPPGSVCFTCIGATIGKMCLTNSAALTNQQINTVIVNADKFDPAFVYYRLVLDRDEIKAKAGGAATPIISKSIFESITVAVPPLATQRKIAAVLAAYDDLIENNNRRINLLAEMTARIYREWFVDYRYPGHESVPMVDSELGPIPEGWVVSPLSSLGTVVMGQSPPSIAYNTQGHGLPFHQGVGSYGLHFPEHRIYSTKGDRLAEDGDVLISVRAPVGRINQADRAMILGRGLAGVRARVAPRGFLLHALKHYFREEDIMGNGSIFKSVTRRDVEGLSLIWPGDAAAHRFSERVDPVWRWLQILTAITSTVRATRDLLLPRLMSGEVDVTALDIAMPEAAA